MKKRKLEVTLFTKPGCHLCDDARDSVDRVTKLLETEGLSVSLEEINILLDKTLTVRYSEDIPVVLINGKRHSYWRVDEDRFYRALKRAAGRFLSF